VLTSDIYRGVVPFIALQLALLALLALWPELVTWLPEKLLA
jgi:TRAP-type mannitol/chloroaromatic compound transport system permease large subunit